ncbi:SBBP repeat-containing protein [Microcoleus sp. Pol12B4]|uniref:SBBP repeat-containing protein n=1 Tax=Microcoleus sp. Pol12B4 TaxID=3055395 RepID=UPI002FD1D548
MLNSNAQFSQKAIANAVAGTIPETTPTMTPSTPNFEWFKQFGTPGLDSLRVTAFDRAGNIYLTGTIGRALQPGESESDDYYTYDTWVAKYDSNGNQLWLKQFSSTNKVTDDIPSDIAVDSAGNVYLTVTSTLILFGYLGGRDPAISSSNSLLVKYDSSGNQLWLKNISNFENFYRVTADNSGNFYLTGTYSDFSKRYSPDVYTLAAKYDSNGNQLWLRQFGSARSRSDYSGQTFPSDLAVDSDGNLYLTGETYGDLGGPNAGFKDIWVAKHNSDGNQLWFKQFGTAEFDFSSNLALDSTGNLYVVGSTDGALGGSNAGGTDIWIAKYNSNNDRLWLKQFGTAQSDRPSNLVLDSTGNIYLTGTTNSAAGNQDIWAAKYNSDGNQLWLKQFGTAQSDGPSNLVLDSTGNIYLTGTTNGSLGGPNAGSQDIWFAKLGSIAEAVTPTPTQPDSSPIIGTDGDDFLAGDRSNNTISGKQGNDSLSGFDGNDRMYGDLGNDCLEGSKGNDCLYGSKGNDTLLGGNGEDVLMGDRGADILNGGDGSDILLGGNGDDLLSGGFGDDSLTGGDGNDRFLLSPNSGIDIILNFEDGKDLLSLGNNLTLSQLSITQDNNATFIRL